MRRLARLKSICAVMRLISICRKQCQSRVGTSLQKRWPPQKKAATSILRFAVAYVFISEP
jgi:hypothetical protein